jgi:hypothetical protein
MSARKALIRSLPALSPSPLGFCDLCRGLPAPSIEIRSLPTLAHCFPRSFTFYVAHPIRSIREQAITISLSHPFDPRFCRSLLRVHARNLVFFEEENDRKSYGEKNACRCRSRTRKDLLRSLPFVSCRQRLENAPQSHKARRKATTSVFSCSVNFRSSTRLKYSTVSSSVSSLPSCRYGGVSLIPRSGKVFIGPSDAIIIPLTMCCL